MPKVQNSILRGIIHGAVKRGANFKQLCGKVGIDPQELTDAEKLLDWEISASAWDYAVEMTQDPMLALHLGEEVNISAFGTLGYLMQSSSTLEEALSLLVKYNNTLSTIFYFSVERSAGELKFYYDPAPIYPNKYPESARQAVDALASSFIQAFYFLTGKRIFPLRAEFTFSKRNFQEYERILQTNMVFNAERNCLIYRHEDVITPIVSYDKSLFSFFNLLLTEKQKTLATQKSFPDEIKELLLSQFGGQIPPIEVVAAHMNMSLRTFQRRLAGEKISFRQITNELRKELALSLMKNPYSKKGDVAQVLGYTDLSSFQRAFKSWTKTF
jgi:AraC-like DNA-binding protein